MSLEIFASYPRQNVTAGAVIFQERAPADIMYVILKGKVTISKHIMAGVEKTMSVLEAGEYFGEMSLLLNEGRSATATAMEDTELVGLTLDDFKQLWREHPEMGMSMLIQLASRLQKTNKEAILLSLEQALAEHQEYAPGVVPGQHLIVATGSFELKHLSEVLQRRGEIAWGSGTKVLFHVLKPGRGQDALLYIFQTDDAREPLKLTSCFQELVQWDFSFAIHTGDECLDSLV